MSDPGESILAQEHPVRCGLCNKAWAKAPLLAIAFGQVPSHCPDCSLQIYKRMQNPPKGMGDTVRTPKLRE